MAEESHRFVSAQAALETFRRGGGGARWHAAAEHLLRNANTDTRMLVDYATAKARGETPRPVARRAGLSRAWLVGLGAAAVATTALVTGFAVYLLLAARCG